MFAFAVVLMCLQEQEPAPPGAVKPQEPQKEVVIIGQRREGDVLDVPSAVTVITAAQLEKSGAANLVEAVQRQPGFFAQGANKGAYDQNLDVRGYNNGAGNGQRTLVLVDGRKTNSVVSTATDWASIPLENVERIEIVRGPAAALYGDGALAGVINIITKKGGKTQFSHATAAGGNWGTYRAAANVGGAAGDVLFDVYAGLEGTRGWRDNSEFRGQNLTARAEGPVNPALRLFGKIGHHEDTRERPGTLSRAQIDALGRRASVTPGDEADLLENYADAGLVQALDDLGEVSLFLNHTRAEGSSFFAGFGGFKTEDEAEISMLQLKHVLSPRLFGREADFTTGADLSYELAEADSGSGGQPPTDTDYRRRLVGVFHHVEVRPLAFVTVSGSLRYDRALLDLDRDVPPGVFGESLDQQRVFDQLSPQAGATFRVVEEVAVYGSWGRTFKYPTRDELVGFLATSPGLDPERSHVYEAGARLSSGRWGSASVSVYRMVVDEEIYFDSTTFTNFNFDEVTHQGTESEARVTPWEWVEVFASHTYTRAVITEGPDNLEGKSYPVTPRLMGGVGTTFLYAGASLTLGGRYAGERFLINDVENTQETLGSYWVFDARAEYRYKYVALFAAVYNLTDREYFDSGGTTFAGPRFNPAPDRSWLVGGELRF